ncbi:MAG: SHOCT domain-containing protein [Nocardioidaceae bacterium]
MFSTEIVLATADGRWDGSGGWWVIFPILWFVVIVGVITAVVFNVRRRGRLSGQRAGERRLAERFASGEIDAEEYESRLTALQNVHRK